MLDGPSWQIILLGILILLSGFFSASETALMSLSKIRIRHLVDEKVKNADIVNKLVENPNRLLGSILVGNNIVNIGASALATSIAIQLYPDTGVAIATGFMTFIILVVGEITPKSLAAQNSESISLAVAGIINVFTIIVYPIVAALLFLTNGVIKIFGGQVNKSQTFITEDELKTMVNVSHEEGVLEVEEKQMIYNVFEFGDTHVRDVMIPRTDMVSLKDNESFEEVMKIFREEQFSRLPVYKDNTDNIIGVLHMKDLILTDIDKESFTPEKYIREPFFTFEFKKTTELFKEMRDKRIPLAIVLDEYGGTAGIITMEDLIEEIVGEINDEYDDHEEEITVVKEDEYVVDGIAKIDEVNEMIGINVQTEDFDSIGGFVVGEFGYIPEVGEEIVIDDITYKVEEVDRNRIEKLRIHT